MSYEDDEYHAMVITDAQCKVCKMRVTPANGLSYKDHYLHKNCKGFHESYLK